MSTPAPTRAAASAQRPSLRERFNAMRNLRPFLKLIWQTSPGLTLTRLGLRLIRAFLPVVMLYIGKLIIDETIWLVGAGVAFDDLATAWNGGALDHLAWLLALEFGLAIGSDLLGRLVSYADNLLSELFTNATSVRLMEHAATLDLEDFEDPELQDKLDRARRQTMGRMNLMGQLFGQVQDAITVVSFAIGLVVYAPWLILLLLTLFAIWFERRSRGDIWRAAAQLAVCSWLSRAAPAHRAAARTADRLERSARPERSGAPDAGWRRHGDGLHPRR